MTQEALANRLGVSARTVSNWERSATVPRNRIGALSDVLGALFDSSDAGERPLSKASDAELLAELALRLARDVDADGDGPDIPQPRQRP